MKKAYIYQTHNFGNSWAWAGRVISFLVTVAWLLYIDLNELKQATQFLPYGYILLTVLVIAMLAWPIDELALDNEHIYFQKRSLFPVFNRVTRYKISELKSIGTYSRSHSLGSLPVWTRNRVEIIFNDDSSRSHDMITNKQDLQTILSKVRRMIADKNPCQC